MSDEPRPALVKRFCHKPVGAARTTAYRGLDSGIWETRPLTPRDSLPGRVEPSAYSDHDKFPDVQAAKV
jgi:hypothetical protein